jgi:hypothetical protein
MWPLSEDQSANIGVWERTSERGNKRLCYFCKTCGVRLIHHSIMPDGSLKATLSVKAGCLPEMSLEGATHIYTRSALVPVPEGSWPGEPDRD